jgi:hypothetical protein
VHDAREPGREETLFYNESLCAVPSGPEGSRHF